MKHILFIMITVITVIGISMCIEPIEVDRLCDDPASDCYSSYDNDNKISSSTTTVASTNSTLTTSTTTKTTSTNSTLTTSTTTKTTTTTTTTTSTLVAPTNVAASDGVPTDKITITWTTTSTATGYNVYRSSSKTGTYTNIGTSTSGSYDDTSITTFTLYWYKVSSTKSGGESTLSAVDHGIAGFSTTGMVSIPGGTFTMGSTVFADTQPLINVTISTFYMDVNLVTAAEAESYIATYGISGNYSTINDNPGNTINSGKSDHPANAVNWYFADDYCRMMGKRLPTEAEWEYAAGGPNHGLYPLHESIFTFTDYCAYNYQNSSYTIITCPIGSYPSNGYGLKDMSGIVSQWTIDSYSSTFYDNCTSGCTDPKNSTITDKSSLKGNSYADYETSNKWKISYRRGADKDLLYASSFGFRCVQK